METIQAVLGVICVVGGIAVLISEIQEYVERKVYMARAGCWLEQVVRREEEK